MHSTLSTFNRWLKSFGLVSSMSIIFLLSVGTKLATANDLSVINSGPSTAQKFNPEEAASPADFNNNGNNSCRPEVRCDLCTEAGAHTCRVINCDGEVTATFNENCIPSPGNSCNAFENCSDCVNHSQSCRTIDCHGKIQTQYVQACNGSGGSGGGGPGFCTPTTNFCDQECSASGTKTCQVLDCNGIPVSSFQQSCTPPRPTYACSGCSIDAFNCTIPGTDVPNNRWGVSVCYNVTRTLNGVTDQIEKVCAPCQHAGLDQCSTKKRDDFRCSRF